MRCAPGVRGAAGRAAISACTTAQWYSRAPRAVCDKRAPYVGIVRESCKERTKTEKKVLPSCGGATRGRRSDRSQVLNGRKKKEARTSVGVRWGLPNKNSYRNAADRYGQISKTAHALRRKVRSVLRSSRYWLVHEHGHEVLVIPECPQPTRRRVIHAEHDRLLLRVGRRALALRWRRRYAPLP